jgi:hypothetical protein
VLRGLLETRAFEAGAAVTLPADLAGAFFAGFATFLAIFIFFNFAGFFAIRLSPKQIGIYYLFRGFFCFTVVNFKFSLRSTESLTTSPFLSILPYFQAIFNFTRKP